MSHSPRLTVLLGLITGLTLMGRSASGQRLDIPSITIRINDYAAVPSHQIERAQSDVTQLYAAIGVETVWLGAHGVSSVASQTLPAVSRRPADLTIIVLGPEMVDKLAPPEDVVGAAPCTTTERGRVAYVFYPRLRMIATGSRETMGSREDDPDLMGLVIAHELGHLLLPYGSHSDTGVMRGRWEPRELQRLDVRQLGFTPFQAQQIRLRASGSFGAP
jgi:hypothetical protein